MIRPPIASNSLGHEVTIECATTAVGYADKVAVSGSSVFAYGFHADSDDWFFQLFQTRVYPNGDVLFFGVDYDLILDIHPNATPAKITDA